MSFGRPLLLLTLLAIPVVVWLYVRAQRRRMPYAVRFTNLAVLADLAGDRPWRRYVPPALFLVALATLGVATARPHVTRLVPRDHATVVLVIDASGSMQAKDVKPTRLAAAQAAVRAFLDRVPKRLRVGLVVFAGDVGVAANPTTDHRLVRASLDQIAQFPGFGGTAIGDALAGAVELAQRSLRSGVAQTTAAGSPPRADAHGLASILFLSDGHQTRGLLSPLEGAQRAKTAGIPVYTVALGTPNGTVTFGGGFGNGPFESRTIRVPPDPVTLRAIARTTGGKFFEARSTESANAAYAKLGSSLGRRPAKQEVTYAFLAGAAGLLLAAGLFSALWSPRLP